MPVTAGLSGVSMSNRKTTMMMSGKTMKKATSRNWKKMLMPKLIRKSMKRSISKSDQGSVRSLYTGRSDLFGGREAQRATGGDPSVDARPCRARVPMPSAECTLVGMTVRAVPWPNGNSTTAATPNIRRSAVSPDDSHTRDRPGCPSVVPYPLSDAHRLAQSNADNAQNRDCC